MTIYPAADCELPEEQCWTLSTQSPDGSDVPCWDLTAKLPSEKELACWGLSVADKCKQNPSPSFDKDIDMDEHGVLEIYAVHIAHEEIYMAVNMKAPDNEVEGTYTDEWGSATNPLGESWAYYPSYKATEIVRVYDAFGNLPYYEGVNEYGYKYIVMDDMDINFYVEYKMDHGYRIIRGVMASAFDVQRHYMLTIISSVDSTQELIGDGCLLMGKGTTVVFTGADSSCFRIDNEWSQISLLPLATVGLNYMLTESVALKSSSTYGYDVVNDIGTDNIFHNDSDVWIFHYSNVTGIMQSANDTVGFPFYEIPEEAVGDGYGGLLKKMGYMWISPGFYDPKNIQEIKGQFKGFIDIIPIYPNTLDFDANVSNGYMYVGIYCLGDYVVGGDYKISYNEAPTKMRMDCREHLLLEDDFIAVLDNSLVHIKFKSWDYQDTYDIFALYDADKVQDYCVYHNMVLIADKTAVLKLNAIIN